MNELVLLARPEIRALAAQALPSNGATVIRLHANENPWGDESDRAAVALNRYIDGQPKALLQALSAFYDVDDDRILVTRGSDEAIDLLIRAFCHAGIDRIVVCPPTFSMYAHFAALQGAGITRVPLGPDFRLDPEAVLDRCTPNVKIVFLCSPNNPTGNALDASAVLRVLAGLARRAVVVVDEAYAELARERSFAGALARHENLVILRTLSKAHGLAGVRCGAALAAPAIISLLSRMLPPYALPGPTVAAALEALRPERIARMRQRVQRLQTERARLREALIVLPGIARVWPSEANFLLVEFWDAGCALEATQREGLLLRDLSAQPGLAGCLRITVGSRDENDRLLAALGAA